MSRSVERVIWVSSTMIGSLSCYGGGWISPTRCAPGSSAWVLSESWNSSASAHSKATGKLTATVKFEKQKKQKTRIINFTANTSIHLLQYTVPSLCMPSCIGLACVYTYLHRIPLILKYHRSSFLRLFRWIQESFPCSELFELYPYRQQTPVLVALSRMPLTDRTHSETWSGVQ